VPTRTTTTNPTRRYHSPIRAKRTEETRAALIGAAARLFTSKGWAGTGMREVAVAAGVATETLYSHFPSKRALLQAVADVAVVGDDEAVALAQRDEFAALGRGRRRDRIAAAASLLRNVNERTAPFAKVLREAAPGDDQIAEMLRATRARQRQDTAAALELLLGRPPTEVELDELWALGSPELYLLFVDEAGWTPDAYEQWAGRTLERVLPHS
jgi:AcrR family transcriptional regulator